MRRLPIFTMLLIFICSCGTFDREPDLGEDVEQGMASLKDLRADIVFTLSPETQQATGLLRFSRSANGKGLQLPVTTLFIDGKEVAPDSTEMNGVFYEVQLPLTDFFKEHSIEFITADKAVHVERFKVEEFTVTPLPETVPVQDLEFNVGGVTDHESVMVMMVDTAFDNNDLNSKFQVNGGRVQIPAAVLQTLATGPIAAEVLYERKIPLETLPVKRGQITIRQGAKSEFQLTPAADR